MSWVLPVSVLFGVSLSATISHWWEQLDYEFDIKLMGLKFRGLYFFLMIPILTLVGLLVVPLLPL